MSDCAMFLADKTVPAEYSRHFRNIADSPYWLLSLSIAARYFCTHLSLDGLPTVYHCCAFHSNELAAFPRLNFLLTLALYKNVSSALALEY